MKVCMDQSNPQSGCIRIPYLAVVKTTIVAVLMVLATGCAQEVTPSNPAMPLLSFKGPSYLHGTVGSLTSIRRVDRQSLFVSGHGLVIRLEGTGSASVPQDLRQWYLRRLRKGGFDSRRLGTGHMNAASVLADPSTAVVQVEGLIPPGATKGTRFDVLVSALPATQTTSLEHGVLYSTELAVGGANRSGMYVQPEAEGRGAIYVEPFSGTGQDDPEGDQHIQQALVVSGGVVTRSRQLRLILNQPSWTRSGIIADRINERFPNVTGDKRPTANALNDTLIDLHIPQRFAGDPQRILRLIEHLFLERRRGFEPAKAQELADLLLVRPEYAPRITLAWQSLGKTVVPVIRQYYGHEQTSIKLAALEAGAVLEDQSAAEAMINLSRDQDPEVRGKIAHLLLHLPESMAATLILKELLDDVELDVRLAAYETLAENNSGLLRRREVGTRDEVKFILDLVPAEKPLIYIVQDEFPRIAIFNLMTPFETPMTARLWDNRLMLKADEPDQLVDVFYQPQRGRSVNFQIAPTVANLIILLAHHPSIEQPHDGLNLSYSMVVNALYRLSVAQHVDAKVFVRRSPLASVIARYRRQAPGTGRPETGLHADESREKAVPDSTGGVPG